MTGCRYNMKASSEIQQSKQIAVYKVQSAIYEKVPAGGCRLWCGAGGMCTGGWTTGLLLVENSMTHQGVTLLHTD
jgi:hypothetical protein